MIPTTHQHVCIGEELSTRQRIGTNTSQADPTARNLMPELGLGGDEPGQLYERARTCAVIFVFRTL